MDSWGYVESAEPEPELDEFEPEPEPDEGAADAIAEGVFSFRGDTFRVREIKGGKAMLQACRRDGAFYIGGMAKLLPVRELTRDERIRAEGAQQWWSQFQRQKQAEIAEAEAMSKGSALRWTEAMTERPPLRLTFKTITGQRLDIAAFADDTPALLRARIEREHGTAANTQRLLLGRELIEGSTATLRELGIDAHSELFLSVQAENWPLRDAEAAVAAAKAEKLEAAGAIGALVRASRLLLHQPDGSPKHWRWFCLKKDEAATATAAATDSRDRVVVQWGKNQDGSDHWLWKQMASAPPKQRTITGVRATGPSGAAHGFTILTESDDVAVAAADESTRATWLAALEAASAAPRARHAMQRAQEMLAGVPARMAEAEKNAREAWRAVQIQGTMAEGEAQLAAKDFGAALASFRKALALDPANAAIKRRVNAAARP